MHHTGDVAGGSTARTVAPTPVLEPLPGFATSPAEPERSDPGQRSFDDLGTPLADVTFVVVDLETTGGTAHDCEITEIGALKLRGGELLGRFETLVNPGVPIPPTITVLTGITEAMVLPAPRIEEVLPSFLEFLGGGVVVGHNVRFDVGFLDAACDRLGYPRLANRRVDTLGLARRLVRDEVPNCRLATLARHLRVPTEPVHRAYADAAATAEVFHALLERAGCLGVLGLDDLLALPSMRAHPSAGKLRLTARLPRAPGVYLFRDGRGRVLYVGKATNLRARVRSYFSGDDRRKVPQMLREVERIDHLVCPSPFEAEVRELRLIQELEPRFNRRSKAWRRYTYVKLTDERFPRLVVTRTLRDDGGTYLGPLGSSRAAHTVREAIESAAPIRRCTRRIGARTTIVADAPCIAAQLGVATCPCRGHVDDATYTEIAGRVRCAMTGADPSLLVDPLVERMARLAADERFEEAAATRDRLGALTRALERQRITDRARATAALVVATDAGPVRIRHGRLVLTDGPGSDLGLFDAPPAAPVCAQHEVDELLVVGRFLERHATDLHLQRAEGTFASVLPRLPTFEPRRAGARATQSATTSVRSVGSSARDDGALSSDSDAVASRDAGVSERAADAGDSDVAGSADAISGSRAVDDGEESGSVAEPAEPAEVDGAAADEDVDAPDRDPAPPSALRSARPLRR